MDEAQPSNANMPITAQFVMPWFMGAAWIPKFAGEKTKFGEWEVQVEAMLRAQGLNEQQQADFVLGALEGEAKRELQLINPREKDTAQKVLDVLKKLYAKPPSKAQVRASFFNCKQHTHETANAFILRLRESFSSWQRQDEGGAGGEGDDLLIDQLMVGLRAGPIKQELSRQLRRNNPMTFSDMCKEARALEQELQDGEDPILSQRVAATGAHNTTVNIEPLKDQIRAELQQGLMGEMRKEIMEQMKALSADLKEEMRTQLLTRTAPSAPSTDHNAAVPQTPRARRQLTGTKAPVFQWDAQGRPICRSCGVAGHVQRRCPRALAKPQDF